MNAMNTVFSRKCFRGLCLLLAAALILLALLSAAPAASALEDPALDAAVALLVDMDNGAILFGKNETESRSPASMVKIMTALMAIEAYERGDIGLTDLCTVNESAFSDIDEDGSTAGFQVGEEIPFEALLYSIMLVSANEGCNVIAEAVDGTVSSFVARMNARALELGCTGTNFANTHGMPNENCYSTAYDLYLITMEAMTHNLFKRICSSKSYVIPATNLSEERVIRNGNSLLNSESTYYYEYASGVKTGYTASAGYCAIATASKDGRDLLSVILGAQSAVAEDGRTEIRSYTDTKRLMNWGFDNFNYRDLLTTMKLMAEIPVKLGRGASSVVLRPEENVVALLPSDADLTQVKLEPKLYDEGPLTAPVEKGAVLGEVTVTFNGQNYGTVNLIANTAVELDRAAYIGSEIMNTLRNKYVRLTITVLVVLLILYVAFIIYYNIRRVNKRKVANELARQRIQEYRRAQSTGMSFEEIEARRRNEPRDPRAYQDTRRAEEYRRAQEAQQTQEYRRVQDARRAEDTRRVPDIQRAQEYRRVQEAQRARQEAQRPAQQRPNAPAGATTGMTFEEIEAIIRKRDEEAKKNNSK